MSVPRLLVAVFASAAVVACSSPAFAQQKLTWEEVTLTTTDKAQIVATWYKPEKAGKGTTPVMMVHGLGGTRAEFHGLATILQKEGYAVIVPDLRGHGSSKAYKDVDDKKLDWSKFGKRDYAAIFAVSPKFAGDLQTCKHYLRQRHNAGELNIEKLCVIASDFGGTLALNWAALDWSWRDLPGYRQGKDVQGLFLLSPAYSEKGVSTSLALRHPGVANKIAMYVMVGQRDSQRLRDAKKIYNMIEKNHKEPEKDGVYLGEVPKTNLRGIKLLASDAAVKQVIGFLKQHIDTVESEWEERKNPLTAE